MKKKITGNLAILPFLLILWLFVQSCGDTTYQPPGDYISGYVFFTDTNLYTSGGYYAISVYTDQGQPFSVNPIRSDSLQITQTWNAYYRVAGIGTGTYFFAVTWVRSPFDPNYRPPVLGTLGCDTSRSCSNHTRIAFPNYTGANYNILAWSDTLRRLY